MKTISEWIEFEKQYKAAFKRCNISGAKIYELQELEAAGQLRISEPWALDPYGGVEVYTLHNCRLDTCYHLTTRDLDRLQRGGVVTLQPHTPEEWEREEIAKENGEEVTA